MTDRRRAGEGERQAGDGNGRQLSVSVYHIKTGIEVDRWGVVGM